MRFLKTLILSSNCFWQIPSRNYAKFGCLHSRVMTVVWLAEKELQFMLAKLNLASALMSKISSCLAGQSDTQFP